MYGMLSFIYHAAVIRLAIISKTNVGTTSYVSPAMLESDAAAKEAGTVVLNGVGVDPGIDHLYAIRTIGEVHANGGKVSELFSTGTRRYNLIFRSLAGERVSLVLRRFTSTWMCR